ncbi:MAG: hypothetical protein K9G46_13525 [Flavobacteriales bacterium]|nr:hypothetical protein [Flavobacteriales bacterium]
MLKKLRTGPFYRQLTSISFKSLSILITFLLAKVYISQVDAASYGHYILLHGYLLTIGTLLGMGQGMLALKSLAGESVIDVGKLAIHGANVCFNLLVFSLLIIPFRFLFQWSDWLTDSNLLSVILYAVALFNFELMRVWFSGNVYIFFKDIIRSVAIILLVFQYPALGADTTILVSGFVIVTGSSIFILLAMRKKPMTFSRFTVHDFFNVTTRGWSVSLGSGMQVFKGWLEIFVAGFLLSEAHVALYSILQKLGKLVNLPLVALNADVAKGIALMSKTGSMPENLTKQVKIAKWFAALFAFGAFIMSPLYVKFYSFEANWINLLTCSILLVSNFSNVLYGPVGLFAQLSSMRRYFVFVSGISICFTFAAAFLSVGSYGMMVLSIISLLSGLLWNELLRRRMQVVFGNTF